eukprot:1736320-Rhodomonas_salina.2
MSGEMALPLVPGTRVPGYPVPGARDHGYLYQEESFWYWCSSLARTHETLQFSSSLRTWVPGWYQEELLWYPGTGPAGLREHAKRCYFPRVPPGPGTCTRAQKILGYWYD